eukprot:scaffold13370_cov63-Phaeocystis_antarctica.AAC.2
MPTGLGCPYLASSAPPAASQSGSLQKGVTRYASHSTPFRDAVAHLLTYYVTRYRARWSSSNPNPDPDPKPKPKPNPNPSPSPNRARWWSSSAASCYSSPAWRVAACG